MVAMSTVLTELSDRARLATATATPRARELAVLHVLDTMGCVAAGADHPVAATLATFLGEPFPPAAGGERFLGKPAGGGERFLGGPFSSAAGGERSLRTAVLVEATLAHVDEFDGFHPQAAVVPAAVVVPAALLTAAREGRDGAAVVDAVLAGYEAVVEAGLRFGGSALYAAWWPTALFGALGSAAAAASVLGLDEERTRTALALAAAGLGGLLTADEFGEGHYLLAGRAAADGVDAAYLARAGARASLTLLDGPATAALGRAAGPESAREGVHLERCAFKAYPCARPLHAVVAAVTQLAAAGVPLRDAVAVRVRLPAVLLRFVNASTQPPGPAEAAASAAFAVTAAIRGRADDVRFYRAADLGAGPHPEITMEADPALDRHLPDHWAAGITMTLQDGRQFHHDVHDLTDDHGTTAKSADLTSDHGTTAKSDDHGTIAKFAKLTGGADPGPWLRLDTHPAPGDLHDALLGQGP
ncbi:hypothetical protein GCM10012278_64950 [Nonomuraea glycinis]|uniref:MmgE/PrpD N-terminal domain-containing protein n=2 Tax=Nonomuraea glycinis TaxID=2047744 RepID=A0A918E7V5_9ACTN|nr:hypothetical protein GCM10012278_64950 [Nonomuraea glycinis]